MLINYLLNALINGSIIAILAVGFAMVYNTTRIFHIAYAALYTLSGYLFYQFFEITGLPFVIALLLSVLLTSAVSLGCDILIYRPLVKKNMKSHPLMIASIGLLIIINNIIVLIWGNSPKIISQFELLNIGILGIDSNRLLFFIFYLIILSIMYIILKKSHFEIVMRSMRDNINLTSVLGLNVFSYRTRIFIFSGIIVAAVGSLHSFDVGVNTGVGLPVFIYAFIALIIGGVGKFEGPILGGFFIGFLQTMAEYFLSSQWVVLTIFVVLLIFLLYLPSGIIPEKRREL